MSTRACEQALTDSNRSPRPALAKGPPIVDQPNIILIITDQQRWDTIGSLGAPWMKTPNAVFQPA